MKILRPRDSCAWWRRRLANSGASLMHVPRMPTDWPSALSPRRGAWAGASPTVGKPSASGVSVSQFWKRRPQGESSTSVMRRSAFSGYQKLSW